MNLDQASRFLHVGRPTLERWVRQGLLADAGLRGAELDHERLAAWAKHHGIVTDDTSAPRPKAPADLLAEAIERGAAGCSAGATSSQEAIREALAALDLSKEVQTTLLDQTLTRERMAATALGKGVAIPHPREPQGELIGQARVSVLYLTPALDWAAADGVGVHTAMLILSPDTRLHLQILSRIAFALRVEGFAEGLLERPSRTELVVRLRQIARDR